MIGFCKRCESPLSRPEWAWPKARVCMGCVMDDPELAWRWVVHILHSGGLRRCAVCRKPKPEKAFSKRKNGPGRVEPSTRCLDCQVEGKLSKHWRQSVRLPGYARHAAVLIARSHGARKAAEVFEVSLGCIYSAIRALGDPRDWSEIEVREAGQVIDRKAPSVV